MSPQQRVFGHFLRAALLAAGAFTVSACANDGAGNVDVRALPDARAKASQESDETTALRLARASRRAGDFESALNLYRGVLARKADDKVEVELGDTLVQAGAPEEAIDVYNKIGLDSPARTEALLGLARAYVAIPDASKGLTYADEALARAPADARVLVTRGVVLDLLQRHAEAQVSYRKVLVSAPHDIAARNDLALSLALAGDYAQAVDILTPMAKSSLASPRVRQNLALVYGMMGDAERAGALDRVDLDEKATAANLRFYAYLRGSAAD